MRSAKNIKPGMTVRMKPWKKIKVSNLGDYGISGDIRKKFAGKRHRVEGIDNPISLRLSGDYSWLYWPLEWFRLRVKS